jgi:tripartite-type tricarboxylate transporter receptor subunit TctC
MLATGTVAKAAPDGYTLLMTHGALVQNEALRPQKPYAFSELAPLAMVATLPIGFAINTSSGANSLGDWVRRAKAEPQKFSYASYGQGSSGHVMGEILKQAAGLEIPHIAYRGGAPAAADLLAGHVSASFGALSDLSPHVPSGKVKIVALTGSARNPRFPDVPTFAEQGYPAVNLEAFTGVLAPAGLPRPVATRLTQEIQRIVRGPELSAKLNDIGYTPAPLNAQEFDAFLRADIERWRNAVQANQIKID